MMYAAYYYREDNGAYLGCGPIPVARLNFMKAFGPGVKVVLAAAADDFELDDFWGDE